LKKRRSPWEWRRFFSMRAEHAEVHAQKKYLDLPAHAAVNAPGQARTQPNGDQGQPGCERKN
jgi:hypothetical protein